MIISDYPTNTVTDYSADNNATDSAFSNAAAMRTSRVTITESDEQAGASADYCTDSCAPYPSAIGFRWI